MSIKPEPTLDAQEYEYILNILFSMSQVIERSPRAFELLDEESIRNHFLVAVT